MNPRQFAQALEALIPLKLAGDWDNVGLLLEGSDERPVRRVMLTIDYSDAVLCEAIEANIDFIIAYHPPIFGGIKRLTRSQPGTRLLLETVDAGLTLWSPHTALDAMHGGVCDWLGGLLGPSKKVKPIEPDAEDGSVGPGRTLTLSVPCSLADIETRLMTALKLPGLRVACPSSDHDSYEVKTVALCPGAGGSLFQNVFPRDLFLTGEMRHHDVLGRVAQGSAVILTEHSNSERGYLDGWKNRLAETLNVDVVVSRQDKDPLTIRLLSEL